MSRQATSLNEGGSGVPTKPPPRKQPTPAPKPTATQPAHPPLATPSTAKAIQQNAQRLGLQWIMRPATVQAQFLDEITEVSASAAVPIIYDGDTAVITAVSLIGVPMGNSRVMCIQIPPAGNYIVGNLKGTVPSQLIVREMVEGTSLPVNLTTTLTDIVGTDVTFNVTGDYFWKVEAFFDFSVGATGGVNCFGGLTGPNGLETAAAVFGIPTSGLRGTVGMMWSGFTSGIAASFTLGADKQVNAGTAALNQARAMIEIYQ